MLQRPRWTPDSSPWRLSVPLKAQPPPGLFCSEDAIFEQFVVAAKGAADWPLPGGGSSMARLRLLARACRADLAVGRLVEAHADALAILAELRGGESAGAAEDSRWGVWAAGPS